jgi:hypothetical protein
MPRGGSFLISVNCLKSFLYQDRPVFLKTGEVFCYYLLNVLSILLACTSSPSTAMICFLVVSKRCHMFHSYFLVFCSLSLSEYSNSSTLSLTLTFLFHLVPLYKKGFKLRFFWVLNFSFPELQFDFSIIFLSLLNSYPILSSSFYSVVCLQSLWVHTAVYLYLHWGLKCLSISSLL